MKIIWSPEAKQDLIAVYAYIGRDNEKAARKQVNIIKAKTEILANTPSMGRPGRVPGTRELVVDKTPYIIPYRCIGGVLQILRVYHTSRKWPEMFG